VDRFTRNYLIILAAIMLPLLFWALYEDPLVSELNEQLEADAVVGSYPYAFRVLRLQNGVAVMSTPRSSSFPVQRALGLIYPRLANRAQDNPDLMEAQAVLASTQKRAKAIVMKSPSVKRVRWELDKDWLMDHGVTMIQGF